MANIVRTRDGFEVDLDKCIDPGCLKPVACVTYSSMGTPLPRCEEHQERRHQLELRIREYESPCPPADFDPDYCGERWSEEY